MHHGLLPEMPVDHPKRVPIIAFNNPLSCFLCNDRVGILSAGCVCGQSTHLLGGGSLVPGRAKPMETLKILVVDDESGMRDAVDRSLAYYMVHISEIDADVGFSVSQASTGEAALQTIETETPDILILDHKLPGISGLDVLEAISGEGHDLLTIMITAYSSLENAVTATKLGTFDFLAKPFNPAELKASVYKTTKHLMLRRQARRLVQEKRQVRFEFISVLAHELKAPLAAVEQYLNILSESTDQRSEDGDKHILTRSLARIRDMRKLILDILDLTRIESGEKVRKMEQLDLEALAHKAIEISRENALKRKIEIFSSHEGDLLMRGDRWELEAVFNNLISNAVKYNREGGRVDVRITGDEKKIVIGVSDTGIGISGEDSKRLFKEFVRIRTPETEYIQGSGLGLATVKRIASNYSGEITLSSVPGKGSEFRVLLQKRYDPRPPAKIRF